MRAILKSAVVAWAAAGIAPAVGLAQTVERVEIYRDAAVITWKAEWSGGETGAMARSFSTQSEPVLVQTEPTSLEMVGQVVVSSTWSTPADADRHDRWRAEREELTLDRALKQAQLDLVEEDLALLRENRSIGGTSEAVMVEDIEEVSEWIHDAFRDALYRRVELRQELAALDQRMADMTAAMMSHASRTVEEHRVTLAPGTGGTLWSRTVEWNAGWRSADAVEVTQGQAIWSQRVAYSVDLPWSGSATVVFVDADWTEATSNLSQAVAVGYDRKPQVEALVSVAPVPASRVQAPRALSLSGDTRGEVALGDFERAVKARHQTTPASLEVVQTTLAMPNGEARVIQADAVSLRQNGGLPVSAILLATSDSLFLEGGVSATWTVRRDAEPGLCTRAALGSRIRHRRAYVIEVVNGGDAPGSVTITEPLPRNRSLEIEVSPDALDGGRLDEVGEQLVWELELQPGEGRTLRFGYDVSHDRDVPVPDWR